jgi:hypothetical protein
MKRKKYQLVLWNPLTHLFVIVVVLTSVVSCLFTSNKLQNVFYALGRLYKGEEVTNTTKFAKTLYLVKEIV